MLMQLALFLRTPSPSVYTQHLKDVPFFHMLENLFSYVHVLYVSAFYVIFFIYVSFLKLYF